MHILRVLDERCGASALRVFRSQRVEKDRHFTGSVAPTRANAPSSHKEPGHEANEAPACEVFSESGWRRQKTSGIVRTLESMRRKSPAEENSPGSRVEKSESAEVA